MDRLLSVIVPVYNAEKYLEKCIDSILHQKYENMEIILVDDGSDDNSGLICDEYAKKDSRIKVYHGENKGLVAVRKFGVNTAKGDLVTFVDSDDWIEEDMYYEMMKTYKQYAPDIISSGIIFDNGVRQTAEDEVFENGLYDREMIENEVIPIMMYNPNSHKRAVVPAVCSKIFQKELLMDVISDLMPEITYGEDAAITYTCVAKADSVVFTEKAWYHYCTHSDSMVTSYNLDSLLRIKQFGDYMELKYKELGIWKQMWYQLKQYMTLFLIPAIQTIYGVEFGTPPFSFPYHLIEKGSQIVIYGAGKVGKAYYRDFYDNNYGKIVGWVDRSHQNLVEKGYDIEAPEEIKNMLFDYVVIAIEEENTVYSVKSYLEKLKIPREKIIWERPISVK